MEQGRLSLARVDKDIGHFIANQRADLGVTQKELASRCHTAQSAISRLECGVISPTLDTLSKICNGLGLELYIGVG